MEPVVRLIAGIFLIAATVAIILWDKIIQWTEQNLFPWIQVNLSPKIENLVREAFIQLDKAAVSARNAAKKAWKILRQFLLKTIIRFERQSNQKWIKRWTSKLIKVLETGKPVVIVRETEEELNSEELPPEIREQWIRYSQKTFEVDFADMRDTEVMAITN